MSVQGRVVPVVSFLVLCASGAAAASPFLSPHGTRSDWPSRSTSQPSEPLGTPAPVRKPSSSYRFEQTGSDGVPVGVDPCRPVHYVVRAAGMPKGAAGIVAESVAAISRATGLVWLNDGATTEGPSDSRPAVRKDLYGDRWAPVLITWSGPAEDPGLARPVAGIGGGLSITSFGNPTIYVSGSLTLDAAQLGEMLTDRKGKTVNLRVQTGTVKTASVTSVTVASTDGYTATYSLTKATWKHGPGAGQVLPAGRASASKRSRTAPPPPPKIFRSPSR